MLDVNVPENFKQMKKAISFDCIHEHFSAAIVQSKKLDPQTIPSWSINSHWKC